MVPKKVIEAAEERIALGGQPVKIGEYKGFEVYACEFQEEMTVGMPELYLWNGSFVKIVDGEEALVLMGSVSRPMAENIEFIKNEPSDTIWWVDNPDVKGERLFSFDKEHIFNLFSDYPHKLTKEQREVFDRENPEWRGFFAGQ